MKVASDQKITGSLLFVSKGELLLKVSGYMKITGVKNCHN